MVVRVIRRVRRQEVLPEDASSLTDPVAERSSGPVSGAHGKVKPTAHAKLFDFALASSYPSTCTALQRKLPIDRRLNVVPLAHFCNSASSG
jgi:hypothetical protein